MALYPATSPANEDPAAGSLAADAAASAARTMLFLGMLVLMTGDSMIAKDAIVRQYLSIESAKADQREFAADSLVGELFDSLGEQQWLHAADSPQEVAEYLRLGAPINGVAKIGYDDEFVHWETPLVTALIDGRVDVAVALISSGADVDAPNVIMFPHGGGMGHTALHSMAQRGYDSRAAILISAGADVNRRTTQGTTPLHFAAGKDNAQLVGALLRAGADPDVREFDDARPDGLGDSPYDQAGPKTKIILA